MKMILRPHKIPVQAYGKPIQPSKLRPHTVIHDHHVDPPKGHSVMTAIIAIIALTAAFLIASYIYLVIKERIKMKQVEKQTAMRSVNVEMGGSARFSHDSSKVGSIYELEQPPMPIFERGGLAERRNGDRKHEVVTQHLTLDNNGSLRDCDVVAPPDMVRLTVAKEISAFAKMNAVRIMVSDGNRRSWIAKLS